jgi:hypothetical protein
LLLRASPEVLSTWPWQSYFSNPSFYLVNYIFSLQSHW